MPRLRVPAPQEMGPWLAAGTVGAASGVFRYDGEPSGGFGWVGSPPALAHVRPGSEVRFRTDGDRVWRLEQDGALLAVADGRRALARDGGDWVLAAAVVALPGPAELLRPQPPDAPDRWTDDGQERSGRTWATDGEVEAVEHAGRPAWRWRRPEETWVVDHVTGVALVHDDGRCRRELLALDLDPAPDEGAFVLPPELLAVARPPRMLLAEELEDELGPERAAAMVSDGDRRAQAQFDALLADEDDDDVSWGSPTGQGWPAEEPAEAPFVVGWWPRGMPGELVSGDPSVPEVLLHVPVHGPDLHLGVTGAGRAAPVRRGRSVRRWEGDGWAFALSYREPADPALLERVVASVPARWELA